MGRDAWAPKEATVSKLFGGTIIGFLQSGPADERDTRGDGRADGWAGPENVCISVQKSLNNVNSSGSLKS